MDLSLLTDLDPDALPDGQLRPTLRALLNVVETLLAEVRALREENQRLRDEINRLKGEQGKPTFKPKRPPSETTDHSSERERRQPREWWKRTKLDRLVIHERVRLTVDPARLPPDAEYKGVETVVVQDLRLEAWNVGFEQEVWYSPTTGQSYRAARPAGYEGAFGPGIKALALALHYGANVTQPKLVELFDRVGVEISSGSLSNLLSLARLAAGSPDFPAEALAVARAGLASSPWQHLDATSTVVDGTLEHCHVLGNELFTFYLTTPSKGRLAVLDVLWAGQPRRYRLDGVAEAYWDWVGLSASARRRLGPLPRDQDLDPATVEQRLAEQRLRLGPRQRAWLLEGLALAAYRAGPDWPVVQALLSDDAPQFHAITEQRALCWVHEGRHYKKLTPYLVHHRKLLEEFLDDFWAFYDDLLTYRQQPTPEARARLEARFDELFATETGYRLLDERIALSRSKKAHLLLVLEHPELPLHNNPAELAARRRVRKRDASFGPRSAAGRTAWDTFHTLAATTQQLRVSFYQYLRDRLTRAGQVPLLADLITEQACSLNLGASWATS
jgi:hypothetical protein